jgi:hypothetical protein
MKRKLTQMLLFIIAGIVTATPSSAVNSQIFEESVYKAILKTTQKIKVQKTNNTSNPLPWTIETVTKTSYDSKSSIERIRDATKSSKFTFDASASGTILSTETSSSVGAEFEDIVQTYYKATKDVEEFESIEETNKLEYTLAPGDSVTIYTNILIGEGYKYSWETDERLKNTDPITVTIKVKRDLTPVFKAMLSSVIKSAAGISNDSEEWGAYSAICQDVIVSGDIRDYIKQVETKLWTTGLDRGSWGAVKAAARKAKSQKQDSDALAYILLGFFNVRDPSHNGWAWGGLQNIASKYLSR